MSNLTNERLGNIVTFKRGYDLPGFNRRPGSYPVISSSGISGYHDEYKKDGEGIVTGRYGTLGEVYYVNGKYWPHNTALYATSFHENEPRYVFYLMKCLGNLATGDKSTVPGINRNDLHELFVPFQSDRKTQRQIASVLSALDDKIELNNKINAELEALAKLIYDYWFVQFDFPDANGKPYRASGGRMVYNEVLKREVPEGWEVRKLGDVIETALGGTPSTKRRRYWDNGTVHWLNSGEVANFPVIESEMMITEAGVKESATSFLEAGTTLLSITRHLRPTILAIDACINQSVVGLRENDFFKSCFLYPYLKNEIRRLMGLRTGAQQPHINKEIVDTSPILFPGRKTPLMTEYVETVQPFYDLIIKNSFQNQELTRLRDWLLPLLMNGQVTVKEAHEQVEGVIGMAAEPTPQYSPQEALTISNNKKPFAKRVLGGKIVSLFKDDPHFTHVKFQKIQFLAEHIAEADLGSDYYFQVAGPYDPSFMHTVANNLKTSKWYEERKYKWFPLGKCSQIDGYFDGYFNGAANKLERLFSMMKNMTEAEAEIIATLYAVWNNRILMNQTITNEELVDDFYKWSDRKQRYSQEQIENGLRFIREMKIEPKGFGKVIKQAKKKK